MQQTSLDDVHLGVNIVTIGLVLQLHHWTKNHSSRDLFKQQVKLSLDWWQSQLSQSKDLRYQYTHTICSDIYCTYTLTKSAILSSDYILLLSALLVLQMKPQYLNGWGLMHLNVKLPNSLVLGINFSGPTFFRQSNDSKCGTLKKGTWTSQMTPWCMDSLKREQHFHLQTVEAYNSVYPYVIWIVCRPQLEKSSYNS